MDIAGILAALQSPGVFPLASLAHTGICVTPRGQEWNSFELY